MSFILVSPGSGGGGGTLTGATNGLSVSGSNVLLGGTLTQNTTVTGTYELHLEQDQNSNAYTSSFDLGVVLPAFGGLNGIGMSQTDGATFSGFAGVVDASGLGAGPGVVAVSSTDLVTGDSSLLFFSSNNAGLSTHDNNNTGSIQTSSDQATLSVDNDAGGGDDSALFQADIQTGLGTQYVRMRYEDATDNYQWKLGVNGVSFGHNGSDVYTFPLTDGTSGQALVTDGAGNLTWGGGGGGSPGGSDREIQFNDSLSFGANSGVKIYNKTTGGLEINRVSSTDGQSLLLLYSGIVGSYDTLTGNGGVLQIASRDGLAASANGGSLILSGGSGDSGGGSGGQVTIYGGAGFDAIKGPGDVNILGGASFSSTSIAGGDITLTGGATADSISTDAPGGSITLSTGSGTGTASTQVIRIKTYLPNGVSGTAKQTTSGTFYLLSGNGTTQIGDIDSVQNDTLFTVDDVNQEIVLDAGIIDTVTSLPAYDDDTAAGVGGLTAGQLYQTTGSGSAPLNAAGIVMVKQ